MNDAAIDRAFFVEPFQDYLSLEAGNSALTVEAYTRDVRRLAAFATAAGAADPGVVTAGT